MRQLLHLDEKTRVPLFAVVATLPVLIAIGIWIGAVSGRVDAAEERSNNIVSRMLRMEEADTKILESLTDIRERLARIEERLARNTKQ